MSACATARPAWIDENIPRAGSGFRTMVTRGSSLSRTSATVSSSRVTTITRAAPPSSSAASVRASSGTPSTSASSFIDPKRAD